MTFEFRSLMIAMDDARMLRRAGDPEGAEDLRTSAERGYLIAADARRELREKPQMELSL